MTCLADISFLFLPQVFELLETVFGAFDRVAKKERVYKVETIGDCYVCVTGAPVYQDDHAPRMCRFASRCMKKFTGLSRSLVVSLGKQPTAVTRIDEDPDVA